MRVWVIANPCIEAAGDTSAFPVGRRAVGFARASDAALGAGLVERLKDLGVEVAGTSQVELNPGEMSGDPVVDLGAHGAKLGATVSGVIEAGAHPLMAGGTCNHVSGILAGLQRAYGPASRIGIVWFDAHGDLNTPKTSGSGMIWGMPLAVPLGLCFPQWREGAGMTAPIPTDRVVMYGVRNLDPAEEALIQATDLVVAQRNGDGSGPGLDEAIAGLAGKVDHLYLHVDSDVLDGQLVPSNLLPEPDGPDLEETLDAIRTVMATGKVRAFGVMSFDPTGVDGETTLDSVMRLMEEGVKAWAGS